MQDVLEKILQSLVAKPGDLDIATLNGEKTLVFELRCDKEDVGKIIGKSGKTISALRTVMNAVATSTTGQKVVVEVVE